MHYKNCVLFSVYFESLVHFECGSLGKLSSFANNFFEKMSLMIDYSLGKM